MHPPFGWMQFFIAASCCFLPVRSADSAPPEFQPADSNAARIHHDGRRLVIHGEPQIIYSASFPYYACPQESWADRFRQIREAGFNAVETRVPWNWHERTAPPALGEYAAMDLSSLTEWMRMAHEEYGLHTILRPGPGDMDGWFMGGWPIWLRAYPPFSRLEETGGAEKAETLRWIRHWYRAFARAVGPEQITRKQPGQAGVILVGVDADACAGQQAENLIARGESLREFGIEVPLFTAHSWPHEKDTPPPLPMMIVPDGSAGSRFVEPVDASARRGETPADADRRLRATLHGALQSGAAWVNVSPFVASTPPPGWQDPGLDELADSAPIRPDGSLEPAYYAAKSVGHWIESKADPLRAGRTTRTEPPPSSLPEATVAIMPFHPPIAIEGIRTRPDDPARADWMAWDRDEALSKINPGSRYALFRNSSSQPENAKYQLIEYSVLPKTGHPAEWAPELAGIRERWYAPGVGGDGWAELHPDKNGWTIRSKSADGYALWMRADFKTPEDGFGTDVSWAVRFRMAAGCKGGIAYLNGQPLRSLPVSPGIVRILLPARYLHADPGTRNTLTLLLIPNSARTEPGNLLDELSVE